MIQIEQKGILRDGTGLVYTWEPVTARHSDSGALCRWVIELTAHHGITPQQSHLDSCDGMPDVRRHDYCY
jgi:hypothetical protein